MIVDILYWSLYRLFALLLWILPDDITLLLMQGLARAAYRISRKHREIIHHNLDLAFGGSLSSEEKKAIGIHAFCNLLDTLFGIMKRERMGKEEVIKNITFEGEEIVQQYKDAGKKILFVTGHQGNWELLSQAIAIKFDLTLVGVGRKLDSTLMDKMLKANRERFNVEMVYKKGAMKGCLKALSQNKAIGILTDQGIRNNHSIEVDFFGHKATHTPLASVLARKFGVALIPAFIHTDDYKTYHIKIYEPLQVPQMENQERALALLTQAQADVMEQAIRAHPKQWFWMHNRWK